ncbi:MAG: hypothetical protein WC322_05685 [Candidatus Paceibacterota bacterium]|jgi:uncharacterized protein (DUF983 family)
MSEDKQAVTLPAMGFVNALTLLFIGAKLFGAITWSWWWVLSPQWIPVVIIICVLALISAAGNFVRLIEWVASRF